MTRRVRDMATVPGPTANSDRERTAAAACIHTHAPDHDDARRLLEALGLTTTGAGK